jgi:hypothetical protein
LRDGNSAGFDGAGGAVEPVPGAEIGGGNSPVYADKRPTSQPEKDALSLERVRDRQQLAEVQAANRDVWRHEIDCDVIHLKRLRPAEHERRLKSFRNGFARLMKTRADPQLRLEAREAYSKLWTRWRRRSVAKYSEALRDQLFDEAEVLHDVWDVGWARLAKIPFSQPPAEVAAMLAKHRGRDRLVAWFASYAYQVAEVIPHLQDRDIPRDLLLFVYRFVLVAVREPDKLTAFWLDHCDVLDRLKPLIREAQARVDALNAGKTVITNEEPAVDEPVKPTAIDAPLAATSLPPDDEEKLSADALALGVYVANLPADELAEYMSAIAGLVERELPPGQPAPVVRLEIVEESPPLIEQEPPAASGATSAVYVGEVESPTPAAVEESTPRLQRDTTNCAVTPEDRLIGLIIKYRVSAADVPLAKEHLHDFDLQYVWQRWTRLGREVDQLDVEAIRARPDRWARFAVWLIDVAAASDPNNPIDPRDEITLLVEQLFSAPPPAPAIVEELPPLVEVTPPECNPPSQTRAAPEASVEVPPESPPPTPGETPPPPASPPPASPPPLAAATIKANALTLAEIAAHNLNSALAHARAGIPIHPVRVTWNGRRKKWDKPPAIDNWQQASTTDEEQIKAWWRDLPAKLGIPAHHLVAGIWCGHPSLRLIVLDCDRHGGRANGVTEFQALVDQHWLPIGPVTETPSNGLTTPHGYVFCVLKSAPSIGCDSQAVPRPLTKPIKDCGRSSRLPPTHGRLARSYA